MSPNLSIGLYCPAITSPVSYTVLPKNSAIFDSAILSPASCAPCCATHDDISGVCWAAV